MTSKVSETAIDRLIEELTAKLLKGETATEDGKSIRTEIAKLQAVRRDRMLIFRGGKIARPTRRAFSRFPSQTHKASA